jgi:MFS family permease
MSSTTTTTSPAPRKRAAMSAQERRSSMTLASIYGLRMLGLFLIMPVFAIYAHGLPGGDNRFLVGLALGGVYGLAQAILQIPFGMASDRFGRKPVMMLGLLIFAVGSFVAGVAHSIDGIIVGRAIQGAGAISAAISAMIADSTRDHNRTKAMAMVGMTIGLSFIISLIAGPVLYHLIGVPGMFALTGILALAAIAVIKWVVPDVPMSGRAEELGAGASHESVLTPALLRLHFSIFVVNFTQVAIFVVVPIALVQHAGIPLRHHWMVYLPVTIGSFVLAVPGIILAESRGHMRAMLRGGVALMGLSMLALSVGYRSEVPLIAELFVFFVGFNLMEALLPSLVSRIAPASRKGLAMGVYNTAQSLGLAAGGGIGGALARLWSYEAVFLACAALCLVWLVVAWFVQAPPHRAATEAS